MMEISAVRIPCLLVILSLTGVTVSGEARGPGIVIARCGQDVELLCNVTPSGTQTAAWIINHVVYTVQRLHNGILTGYSLNGNNLIIENIMMNDDRNDTEYSCGLLPSTPSDPVVGDILNESDSTILYVAAGVPAMVPDVTVDNSTIRINRNIVTLTLNWREPFNNCDPIVNYTVSCSGDDACPPNFNTTDNAIIFTNLTPMTTYTFSVVATNSIGSGEAGVVMITTPVGSKVNTPTTSVMNTITSSEAVTTTTTTTGTTSTTSGMGMSTTTSGNDGGGGSSILIIVVIIILIIVYCCLMFLFFYFYARKEKHYQDKDIFDARNSSMPHLILGVVTFGISILVWYMYVKCKGNNEDDDDEYCRIVHVSITVLVIYTFGTSLLLWWLYKKFAKCCCDHVEDDSKVVLKEKRVSSYLPEYEEINEPGRKTTGIHYAVSPQALSDESKNTTKPALQYDYASTGPVSLVVPNADKGNQSALDETQQQTAGGATDVPINAHHQSSVPHKYTTSGMKYAVSDKASGSDKPENQEINYVNQPAYVNAATEDSSVPYAEII